MLSEQTKNEEEPSIPAHKDEDKKAILTKDTLAPCNTINELQKTENTKINSLISPIYELRDSSKKLTLK